MKKLITLLLVLVLSFSLFASCKKKQDSTPESTGTPQTSETVPESKPESAPQAPSLGDTLASALASQVKSANSMKIELHADIVQEDSGWKESWDNDKQEYVLAEYAAYMEVHADVTVLLSKDANGLDASITVNATARYDADDELEEIEEMTPVYIIDNNVYVINYSVGGYVLEAEPSDMLAQLTSMANGEIITAEDEALLFGVIGEMVATVFEVKDEKGSISIDAKPVVVSTLDYLKALDLETKTVESFINDVLALVDPTLEIADILVEVKRFAGLTVNQALAEIDAFLTQNYGTTLQGIYDELVSDDDRLAMILDLADAPADQMAEIMAQIKAMKIADMVDESEMGDLVLFDAIIMITGATEGAPTADQFFDMLDSMLAMTLAEFEEYMGAVVFSSLKMAASLVTVNALDAKMDIAFTNVLTIDYATVDVNFDIEMDVPSDKEGEMNHATIKMDAIVKVSEISSRTLDIAIPSEMEVYDFLAQGTYYTENGYVDIYSGGEVNVYIYGQDFSATIYSHVDIIDLTSTTITLTADDIDHVNIGGYDHSGSFDGTIVITLDPATDSCTITGLDA